MSLLMLNWSVFSLVLLPFGFVLVLGTLLWCKTGLNETWVARAYASVCALALLAQAVAVIAMASLGEWSHLLRLGAWYQVHDYTFYFSFLLDTLSLVYSVMASLLFLVISAFSRRYLHKEAGYFRFYLLLAVFQAGTQTVVLAANLDLLFLGWELVGLSSALLIAFFQYRQKPVEHGLLAFVTYRVCDIGLLSAAVVLHHLVGSTRLLPHAPFYSWPLPAQSIVVSLLGVLLLFAAMGKSAQFPFSGWLPRAMEGPTPSSAIFYGAISVHLGAYLLLRSSALLEASTLASTLVVVVGATTALYATLVGRVQTDIKSVLAYASLTQVGIIFCEIGLGYDRLALLHIASHALLRSLQILRSPNLLHDHHHLEQAVGQLLPRTGVYWNRWVPTSVQDWLYRFALERAYVDNLLKEGVVGSYKRLVGRLDVIDKRASHWLGGDRAQQPAKTGVWEVSK